MAVKNRALTIATRGLLSAAAITIATNGIIQLPTGVAPPVEVPAPAQGGGVRAPGEVFRLEYPKLHRHLSVLDIEFDGQSRFEHVHTIPADFVHRTSLDVYLWGDVSAEQSVLYTARSSLVVSLVSGTTASDAHVVVYESQAALELAGDSYARVTHPGHFDHAPANALAVTTDTVFEFERDDTEPKIHPAVFSYTGDGEIDVKGAAQIGTVPAPPVLFEYTTEGLIHVEGAGEVKLMHYDTVESVEHGFTSSETPVLTITGAAEYLGDTAQAIDVRTASELDLMLYGTAAALFAPGMDVLPVAGNEDDDILVLFTQIMSDES